MADAVEETNLVKLSTLSAVTLQVKRSQNFHITIA